MISCSTNSIIQPLLFTNFAFSITEDLCLISLCKFSSLISDFLFPDNPEFLLEISDKDYRKQVLKAPVYNFIQKDSTVVKICSHTFYVKDKGISIRFYHAFMCVFLFFFFLKLTELHVLQVIGQADSHLITPYLSSVITSTTTWES